MAKVLNFGSLNIDYVYNVPHILLPSETLAATNRNVFAGGKGLNQSVAVAKANGNIYHAGAVGSKDSELLINELKNAKVDYQYLKYRDIPSGHTIIQVDQQGQNCILLFGGANQTLTKEDIDQTLSCFAPGDYLILQNETNYTQYLIESGYKLGLKVCFNVSPFDPSLLKLPLELCSFLVVNEIEGGALVDLPPSTEADTLIEALSTKFKYSNILLTLGTRGSYLKLQEQSEVIKQKCFKVDAVDTTAAGDTFLGYFIAGIANNQSYQEALLHASAASAIAVTRKGAVPSIPQLSEVEEFLKQHN